MPLPCSSSLPRSSSKPSRSAMHGAEGGRGPPVEGGMRGRAARLAGIGREGEGGAPHQRKELRPKELSSQTLGVRLHLTGPTVPDPLPARDGSSVTTCPGEWSAQPNNRGPGPPTGSRTPTYYSDPSAGREQTPRLGGGPEPPRVHRYRHARDRDASPGRLAHLPHSTR